ncbi:MAG: hypothetical protein DLM63_09265 [Solirubrobacterales bacterium]|nr:MAG: hypothetical protein DLM63_09265 [Solirubrobacterales bacterium]
MLQDQLMALDRAGERSITQQLVDAFSAAIETGELAPGAQLPPTRALAETAGINQLTAGRAYKRLQEMGLVVSGVGRGTFVRETAALHRDRAQGGGSASAWQTYALPEERDSAAGRMVGDLAQHVEREDLIALSAGYPPSELFPLEQLRDATAAVLAEQGPASFHYAPVEGLTDLRVQLAALGRRRGSSDDPDCILVTTGARQALTLATRAVLRPGDAVACESPTFMGVIEALGVTGAELLPVPIDEHGLDIDALEHLLARHEIRLLAIQSRLQNPTGADLSEERRRRLVELAQRHSFFILEDSVYADLRYEGTGPPSLRALDPDHVIAADSLSKTLSPGLRSGWIAASGPVLDRIIVEKRNDDTHSPTLTQQIVARFLADGHYEPQLELARRMHRERRDALLAAIGRHMGDLALFTPPAGGGHVWLTLRSAVDEAQLYRQALAAGVSFTPGSTMLVERARATHMRLSFSMLAPDQLEEGVRLLAGVVRSVEAGAGRHRSMPMA